MRDGMGGLTFNRRFTVAGQNVFETTAWARYDVTLPSGKVLPGLEFPTFWSENAKSQVAEKYFRKADVPQFPEGILDAWGCEDQEIDWTQLPKGAETSLKQVANRLAGCIADWGWRYGYFTTVDDYKAFYDEMAYSIIHQYGVPNSPQWFNTGLFWAYGIKGDAKGQWYFDFDRNEAVPSTSAYEHPQAHACFILGVKDDLFGPKGIFDTAQLEAKIFYFGSGTGSNYSTIRSNREPVSGGGRSSGLLSFLRLFDTGGGIIKSGGKNRRAAKMDIISDDHPEILDFIRWKMREEKKVRILIEAGLDNHFEGEAYSTVSGMNSNNTVSFSHDFFRALREGDVWQTRWVTNRDIIADTYKAQDIWDEVNYATWFSADPGIHARGTINDWNPVIADEEIVSSNPCSEYLFLNETACNLASQNLVKYYEFDLDYFNVDDYRYHVDMWMIALDITVSMAQYPSKEFAEKSIKYRTTGLGYSNLGGLLMLMGYSYDSEEGRAVAGAITAIMGGQSYITSARLAKAVGAYPRFEANREGHLRVIRNHRRASYGHSDYEGVTIKPTGLLDRFHPTKHGYLLSTARLTWDQALEAGEQWGYRNAQTTVLAPTGTISYAMDCDTQGVEPDFALKKAKLMAGGGWMAIVNQLVPLALQRLGYGHEEIEEIEEYVFRTGMIEGAPYVRKSHYAVFDTAVKAKSGTRFIHPNGHIDMMAAVQPFLSGAISKTINLPESATIQDISDAYLRGYYSGLKAIAVYRDNSKASQALWVDPTDKELSRKPLDLNAREFDTRDIFGTHSKDDYYEVPGGFAFDEQLATEEVNLAEVVEQPKYGCKDGSCSI